MKVFYLNCIDFPNSKAHSIQAINTCHALAEEGVEVNFFIRELMSQSQEEVLEPYGLKPHKNLVIRGVPFEAWDGPLYKAWLSALLMKEGGRRDTFLLLRGTRCLESASFLIRWKALHRLPVIYEAHEIVHLSKSLKLKEKGVEGNGENAEWLSRLKELEKTVYGGATGLICISESLQKIIMGLAKREGPMLVAHDGCQALPRGDGSRERKEDIDILYTGRLKSRRGVDLLIDALRYLPNRRLMVVGGNTEDDLKRLQALVKTHGLQDRVAFSGHVKPHEVAKYLWRSKVSVIPFLKTAPHEEQEGYASPLKLFEAMVMKTPIVASDMPSLREVLRSGENALLFEPNDARALAMAIEKILGNEELAKSLALKAYEDVKEYTWQRRAQRILVFLQSLGE